MGNPIWGTAVNDKKTIEFKREQVMGRSLMPDVIGMGARDAVYIIESRGLKTRLVGRGKVTEQSIAAGQQVRKGMVCRLVLR